MSMSPARLRIVRLSVFIFCSIVALAGYGMLGTSAKTGFKKVLFAVGLTATNVDSLAVDADGDGRVDPGDTVQYNVTINNGGGTAVSGVKFTDNIDPNETLVNGSLAASPVAADDGYSSPGGALNAPAPGVLANDYLGIPAAPVTSFGPSTGLETTVSSGSNGTTAGGGTIKVLGDGSFVYTPPASPGTSDTFKYVLSNATAAPFASDNTATVTITLDQPPTAVNDSATVAEDAAATAVNVLANDTDPDGGSKSVASVTQPTNGTVAITGGGTGLTYAPNANYCNTPPGSSLDTFTYTLTPGGSTATVSMTVTCVDDGPVAVADAATVNEDSGASAVTVLANDTDVDGGPKSIASVTQPANGAVVITGGGTGLTYAPNANYCNNPPGTTLDTFTYTLTPGSSSTTVTMTVTCVDDNPVAVADAATVTEDSGANAINVLANDTDVDGGSKSIASVTQPANGAVVITGGGTGVSYAPNANYCNAPPGTTPDTFTYTLTPGGSSTTASMTVTCVDDAPVAVNDAATVVEDSGANAVNVLANDTDIDGGPESVTSVTQPANGAVVITGGGTGLTYAPNANYCNNPPGTTLDTFTYTLAPGGSSATVTMTVTCVNDAPVVTTTAGNAAYTEDDLPLAIDAAITVTDVDSTTLASATIQITTNNQSGEDVLSFTNDGSTMGNIAAAAYVPATGLLTLTSAGGTATLAEWQNALRAVKYNNTSQNPNTTARTVTFKANDGTTASSGATRGITVTAVNDAPTITRPATITVNEDTQFTFSAGNAVSVADVDAASGSMSLTVSATNGNITLTTGGGATIGTNGTHSVTASGTLAAINGALAGAKYQGDLNYYGSDTISLNINDNGNTGTGGSLQANASIGVTVSPVNDPPVAVSYCASGCTNAALPAQAGIPITFGAGKLGGTDEAHEVTDGSVVSVVTTPDSNCTSCLLTINANGGFTFTPPPTAAGQTVSFTYHVVDTGFPAPGLNSTPVTVSFSVAGPALYFVKSAAVGAGNCTLGNECTLATAVTNIGTATNARIFLEDANNHNAAVPLTANSWLVGQGVTGTTFDAFLGINGNPGSGGTLAARPSLGSSRPTVQNTVTLNTNCIVRGLNISSTTNTGIADPGATAITGVSVSEIGITTTTGTGVSLSDIAGTLTFDALTTNGGTGVNLIDGSAAGSNSGATFTFTGVSIVATGANPGFVATGGGAVTVCDENPCGASGTNGPVVNTISSAVGTALNVANTNIGTSNLELQKISSNGAANGILINNTGATGSFKLKGNGGTCNAVANCTGGAIQNSTNSAVSLTSTLSPSISRLAVQNAARSGIDGQQVTNFILDNSFIDNVGTGAAGQYEESNISFNDGGALTGSSVSGTVSITNCILNNARRAGIMIENGSGTISSLTISNNTLTSSTNSTVSLGNAIHVAMQGSASSNANLTTGTINQNTITNFPSGEGILVVGGSGNGSNNTSSTLGAAGAPINITNNTISGQAAAGQHTGSNSIHTAFNGQFGVMNVGSPGTELEFAL